eukprot:NODE_510_length_6666_cov_0.619918.p6 type:complete len:126 gc:universal NODE_510_length_6666_cov_0.619918:1633-2010(+)
MRTCKTPFELEAKFLNDLTECTTKTKTCQLLMDALYQLARISSDDTVKEFLLIYLENLKPMLFMEIFTIEDSVETALSFAEHVERDRKTIDEKMRSANLEQIIQSQYDTIVSLEKKVLHYEEKNK